MRLIRRFHFDGGADGDYPQVRGMVRRSMNQLYEQGADALERRTTYAAARLI